MLNLEDYLFVYEVTALPTILYAQITKATEPMYFEGDFCVPTELRMQPTECRIALYNKSGGLVELSSKIVPAQSSVIKSILNIVPLKMLERLLNSLS